MYVISFNLYAPAGVFIDHVHDNESTILELSKKIAHKYLKATYCSMHFLKCEQSLRKTFCIIILFTFIPLDDN